MISNIYFYKTSEVVLSLRLLYSLELFKSRGKNIKLGFFFKKNQSIFVHNLWNLL